MNDYQKNLVARYQATNRVAFYHPRKQTISLNGGRELPINEAIRQIVDTLTANNQPTQADIEKRDRDRWNFMKQKRHPNY